MNFLTNIIDYLIIYTFLENAFSGKKIMNVKFILTLHSFLCIALMAFSAKIPEWHTLVCIVVILSTSFYYKESAPMKILMVTFLFVLCVLSRFLAMSLVGHIFSGTPIHGLIMMMHIQLEQVIEIIIKYIAVFIWCLTKKAGNLPLPKEANMILLVVLIATTLGAYALYQVLIAEKETNHYKIFTISLIILFGIHYLILVMLEQFNIVLSKAYESKLALQEKFFEEEKALMKSFNKIPFDTSRYLSARVNKQGLIRFETNLYSASPSYVGEEVKLRISAERLDILTKDFSRTISSHRRLFEKHAESIHHLDFIDLLKARPRALKYSGIYAVLPDNWKDYLEGLEKDELRQALEVLKRILTKDDTSLAEAVLKEAQTYEHLSPDSIYLTYKRMKESREIYEGFMDMSFSQPGYETRLRSYDSLMASGGLL